MTPIVTYPIPSTWLVFVGVSTLNVSWRARDLIAVGVVAILIHILVVRCEEPDTRHRLGPACDEHCAGVSPRIPSLSRGRNGQVDRNAEQARSNKRMQPTNARPSG
jgi:hypothetical protein